MLLPEAWKVKGNLKQEWASDWTAFKQKVDSIIIQSIETNTSGVVQPRQMRSPRK